jgi:2-oxoglutarate dehydrogenase E1 component
VKEKIRKMLQLLESNNYSLPVEQLKAIIAKYPNADDYVWHKKNQKHGSIQFYVDEFRFSKMEIIP